LRELTVKTNSIASYFNLIKPRETLLLAFIGVCAGIIASKATMSDGKFLMLVAALLLGSAGCNGITNYLDRKVDALMDRTRNRALPKGLVYPAENALLLVVPLIVAGLAIAWFLNPWCFVAGIVGVLASTLWRKTITCTIFGIIAGICPVIIGWFAFSSEISISLILICLLVALWIPVHVWSVMVAKKDEYKRAGLNYFPLNMKNGNTIGAIFGLTLLLYGVSMALFFFGGFGKLFLIVANILSILMVAATGNLLARGNSSTAWRVYKLSSFPYLGMIFLAMTVDTVFMQVK
jgi:heme o synthase